MAELLLVLLEALRSDLQRNEPLPDALFRLARSCKAGTLAVQRSLLDAGWLTYERFGMAWSQENKRLRKLVQSDKASGGNFRRTTLARVGRWFAHALAAGTVERQTLYRDAFRMLGVGSSEALDALGRDAWAAR